MENIKTMGFVEMSMDELQQTDGGLVIFGVTIAGVLLIKIAGAVAGAGLTAGITIGLNNKNRK